MEYLIGAVVVFAIWAIVSIQKKKKAFASHHAADLAEPWLSARGVDRDSLMFNTYNQSGFARAKGAVVIVGVGKRSKGADFGFVAEVVPGRGVVNGEELIPFGIASWDRQAAQVAAESNRPMMDVLLEMAARHRSQAKPTTANADSGLSNLGSASPITNSSESTSDGTPQPAWLKRFASAPDFMIRKPERVARIAGYLIVHVKDVRPLGARLPQAPTFPLRYPHALVIINEKSKEPELFVTLELGIGETPFLCIFRRDGSRINLGDGSAVTSDGEFLRTALSLASRELNLATLESGVSWS